MVNQLDGTSLKAVAARITALRSAMGLNATTFAKRCKIGKPALSNYEKARRRPSMDQAGKIAGATGAPVDWIIFGTRQEMLPGYLLEKIYER